MTITLTPETETLLRRRAERDGQDPNILADILLADVLVSDPDVLTDDEIAQIRAGIRQGLEDCDAGLAQPVGEWAAKMRRDFSLPTHLSDNEFRR